MWVFVVLVSHLYRSTDILHIKAIDSSNQSYIAKTYLYGDSMNSAISVLSCSTHACRHSHLSSSQNENKRSGKLNDPEHNFSILARTHCPI